jgi:hypothetical protein
VPVRPCVKPFTPSTLCVLPGDWRDARPVASCTDPSRSARHRDVHAGPAHPAFGPRRLFESCHWGGERRVATGSSVPLTVSTPTCLVATGAGPPCPGRRLSAHPGPRPGTRPSSWPDCCRAPLRPADAPVLSPVGTLNRADGYRLLPEHILSCCALPDSDGGHSVSLQS